ncbi:protein phosphatase 1 regulatory subunit 3G [Varanus komodoensis]|uniref:Protein phosphatase 1 regulatory subunit 3G n=1 Tax=Varanus komodoensis TaxID=61221 RepID=A0A8D2KRD3_VARKO|nr:protein phosphatase 1 regulatory subunit 3G [Varanus komodoensis]
MESRSAAVLGLGQLLAPFGEHQQQEEVASVPPWRGDEEEAAATGDHVERQQPWERDEEALLELRRRRGRSLSLPASPTLAAARLFPRGRLQGDGDEGDDDGASGADVSDCCTKCKKRVQFADSLGLCLASVKHFSAAEEPQVPPAVLSRLQSFPMRQKDFEEFSAALAELGGCAAPSFARSPPQVAAQALQLEGTGKSLDLERLERERVCLEEAAGTALAGVPTDIRGVVRVLSCPGPKEVTVRYTFNEWLSFLDSRAVVLPAEGNPADPSSPVERYQFILCLPPSLPDGTAVHFAICYRSQQGEYWDNNGGDNYTLRGCTPEDSATSSYY